MGPDSEEPQSRIFKKEKTEIKSYHTTAYWPPTLRCAYLITTLSKTVCVLWFLFQLSKHFFQSIDFKSFPFHSFSCSQELTDFPCFLSQSSQTFPQFTRVAFYQNSFCLENPSLSSHPLNAKSILSLNTVLSDFIEASFPCSRGLVYFLKLNSLCSIKVKIKSLKPARRSITYQLSSFLPVVHPNMPFWWWPCVPFTLLASLFSNWQNVSLSSP